MSPQIKNVALAGVSSPWRCRAQRQGLTSADQVTIQATGNVGTPTLKALLEHKFNVTVLSRNADTVVPAGVTVTKVDYSDKAGLTAALKGIDAVVDTTSVTDKTTITNLIEAAEAAGVHRFIPSSFGADTEDQTLIALPVFAAKETAITLLKQRAAANPAFTWTAVSCGGFLDWNLKTGFTGIQLQRKQLKLLNDGENLVPWTTLGWTGVAVAGVLSHAEETCNRVVYVCNCKKTQLEMASLAKEVVGADGWTSERLDMDAVLQNSMAELRKGNYSFPVFGDMIKYAIAHPDYANSWRKGDDSALLGVKAYSDDDIKVLMGEIVRAPAGPDFF
jgi:putative NADH-flavin reductase